MSASKSILVFGSTGKQGGATVRAIVQHNEANPENTYRILAVTRDLTKDAAKALSALPSVEAVAGDLDDAASIDAIFEQQGGKGSIYGVFRVQDSSHPREVAQGNLVVDVAVKYGVKRFVYTGSDLSGQAPSPILRFETKRQIQLHLHAVSAGTELEWTVLRPSGFLENIYWPVFGKVLSVYVKPGSNVKTFATSDIGRAAVEALIASDNKFVGITINLTGDSRPVEEVVNILRGAGVDIPEGLTEKDVPVPPMFKIAFDSLNEFGPEGTPEDTKKYFPWVKDLPTWIETEYLPTVKSQSA